ncbi:MAG TPA: hypothetical protein VFU72_10165 [Nitrolancea sp.]|nr:hypothetical protein [Nitrolancea sp.]
MNVIRFTVIDDTASSFVGPCHAIKMLVAACSRDARTLGELLAFARPYDAAFVTGVQSGLAVFDEHNTAENFAAFRQQAGRLNPAELPPFRVLDESTRALSLTPAGTGLIMFNLPARRIIQVQNSYADVLRTDRGRVRENGRPTRFLYHYELPSDWRILP